MSVVALAPVSRDDNEATKKERQSGVRARETADDANLTAGGRVWTSAVKDDYVLAVKPNPGSS